MEESTIFTPLQKALKSRVDSPVVATLSLVEAVGKFSEVVKTHYGSNPADLIPVMADIMVALCIISNGAGHSIPDVKTSMQFHGADNKSMTLRIGTQELIGHAARLLQNPREGVIAINQINSNLMSICVAHDIDFKSVVDYAVAENKKK